MVPAGGDHRLSRHVPALPFGGQEPARRLGRGGGRGPRGFGRAEGLHSRGRRTGVVPDRPDPPAPRRPPGRRGGPAGCPCRQPGHRNPPWRCCGWPRDGRTPQPPSIEVSLSEPGRSPSWKAPSDSLAYRLQLLPAQVEIALARGDAAVARAATDELAALAERFGTVPARRRPAPRWAEWRWRRATAPRP